MHELYKRMVFMKKKLFAVVLAAVMVLALPAMAFAAPSPSIIEGSSGASNGTTLTVTANGTGDLTVVETPKQASNVALSGSEVVVASFEVTNTTGDATDITLTFNVGTKYAGANAKVFIEHNDGTTEVKEATVSADGYIIIKTDGLSVFTVVVDPTTATGTTAADTSSVSPQTGVDMTLVAAASGICFVGAGAVAFALRKRMTK